MPLGDVAWLSFETPDSVWPYDRFSNVSISCCLSMKPMIGMGFMDKVGQCLAASVSAATVSQNRQCMRLRQPITVSQGFMRPTAYSVARMNRFR